MFLGKVHESIWKYLNDKHVEGNREILTQGITLNFLISSLLKLGNQILRNYQEVLFQSKCKKK